ncbi:nitrogen permease regulator 2-domain-containing protein [Kickxella alabastrina]|uniref:nitrogen permease regulator 2-domain-containing protein n=1 Tax=Kickxella alabastrina TaxID=61397 RepID=UPI0022201C48|nr:nitrogen permease regulator 2-domain-containing protein [Kickxella alabastrina]KAI7822490.1 nitrogen permease regulator 2-domain-containing protein [Kickxella alabastrina]
MSYTDEGGFPDIKAVFLAEFDTEKGPLVRISYPEDAVQVSGKKSFSDASRNASGVRTYSPPLQQHHPFHRHGSTSTMGGYNTSSNGPDIIHLIKRPAAAAAAAASAESSKAGMAGSGDKIDFNSIEAFVIPKLTLFERLITVSTGPHKVMCYPICIQGAYARNALIFNMCFAFDISANTKCYRPVVKRVGCLLKELETSGRLLSNPEGRHALRTLMQQLVRKLNAHGEYQIELDLKGLSPSLAFTGISIKLFPHYENPKEIGLWHVPVRTVDFEMARMKSAMTVYQEQVAGDLLWDLVLENVLLYMDNINHVGRIAQLAQIDAHLVVSALRHLDYYGCIALIDIFQFGNIYETQYPLMNIYRNAWLQRECHRFVTNGCSNPLVGVEELVRLYGTLRNRQPVGEWILERGTDLVERVDMRRFVAFGVMQGILRRVHCYPVLGGSAEALPEEVVALVDGSHHLDEISVVLDRDIASLKELFDAHGGIEYIYM